MLNTELLKKKIDDSGLKTGFIVDKLGISHQAYLNKINGYTSFKLDEIQNLCNILNLSAKDREEVFFFFNE